MARVRLLHWKAAEAEPLLRILMHAGHSVDYEDQFRSELMRQWRKSPPDVFVIDLSRLPSHGKEMAVALRQSPSTRHVPIIFCEGEAHKVEALRTLMPDATYCDRNSLKASVRTVLASKPDTPVTPAPMMQRYAGRTTAQKLGIQLGSKVALFAPPAHVEALLGGLPPDVEFVESEADVTLCFLHDPDGVRQAFSNLRSHASHTKLWVLWRKKNSGQHAGITELTVRETGLSVGLVDYKICSVDANWSAMLFARKATQRSRDVTENQPSVS